MAVSRYALALIAFGLILGDGGAQVKPAAAQARVEDQLKLPQPQKSAGMSLTEAMARRRSVREFAARALTREQLGQLLWAAQGITSDDGKRSAPSAGALYPLEIYVATAEGLHHYQPRGHKLEPRTSADVRPALARAALGQSFIAQAAAVFIIAADYQRTARKYGPDRSPRYVHIEAGHAAQNLLLQATALGLAGVPVGAFIDEAVRSIVSLPPTEQAVYLIVVGYSR